STMKGVMIPGVSAGSNQVGAKVVWMPQLSCPCGAAAQLMPGAPAASPSAVRASISRRVMPALVVTDKSPRAAGVVSIDVPPVKLSLRSPFGKIDQPLAVVAALLGDKAAPKGQRVAT